VRAISVRIGSRAERRMMSWHSAFVSASGSAPRRRLQ
jgi:hypothetical protein